MKTAKGVNLAYYYTNITFAQHRIIVFNFGIHTLI